MAQREPDAWNEIVRTAAAVRAEPASAGNSVHATLRRPRFSRVVVGSSFIGAVLAVCAFSLLESATPVVADYGADATLFSLTNQDRASNGVRSLSFSGTLQNIGEGAPYGCGGMTVDGRSVDMIRRGYFSHVIEGCGVYVFSMMQAYGVRYLSAGENIGWVDNETSGGSAASYINGQFMNSPEHRDNILNGNYTAMGAGSAYASSWTCGSCGGTFRPTRGTSDRSRVSCAWWRR